MELQVWAALNYSISTPRFRQNHCAEALTQRGEDARTAEEIKLCVLGVSALKAFLFGCDFASSCLCVKSKSCPQIKGQF
jgi:hypothetical protein